MNLDYPSFTPENLRYRYCPMCAGELDGLRDHDGLFRAACASCGWTYYPPNLLGVNVVITTPDGLVCLLPPGEPPESPAALPGGSVEFGETPEEAAVREAREETGLEVEVVRELGRYHNRDMPPGPMLSFIFEARMVGGSLSDSPEGRVVVCRDGEVPRISPNRQGSRRALAAYLDSRWSIQDMSPINASSDGNPRHIVAVMGVVTNRDGQLLLVRTERRGWEPPGGQVELGEDLVQALQREVREESGCSVEVGRLVGAYSNVRHLGQVMFTFLCSWAGGEPCGGDECSDAGWFTREEALRTVTHPAQLAKLRDALAGDGRIMYRAYATRPYQVFREILC